MSFLRRKLRSAWLDDLEPDTECEFDKMLRYQHRATIREWWLMVLMAVGVFSIGFAVGVIHERETQRNRVTQSN